jgi:hypothetical protein
MVEREMSIMLEQIIWLVLLALPVACVAWTVTHEEIFREPREWLEERSRSARSWWVRKFCYVWTCEYCFSHYVAAAVVALTNFQLLILDWRGYVIAWLAIIFVANVYLSLYTRLHVETRKVRTELKQVESQDGRTAR